MSDHDRRLTTVETDPQLRMSYMMQQEDHERTHGVPEFAFQASIIVDPVSDTMSLKSNSTMGTIFGSNSFSRYCIDDLTNYTMSDQRWTLQRKKIGLKRKTVGINNRKFYDEQSKELTLNFVKGFRRRECVKFVVNPNSIKGSASHCYCGQEENEHRNLPPSMFRFPGARTEQDIHNRNSARSFGLTIQPAIQEADENDEEAEDLYMNPDRMKDDNDNITHTHHGINRRIRRHQSLLGNQELNPVETVVTVTTKSNDHDESVNEPDITKKGADEEWEMSECIHDFPTNAFGMIDFINETSGSSKPAKYLRVAHNTSMDKILSLFTDYWRLTEPSRPSLVISVTGGAKNFKLDGKKKIKFNSGLLKAVKSTNAWIMTGGMNVGIMKTVGEAVNEGQNTVKIKRKNLFGEETLHFVRGIKCIAVSPFGYIKGYDSLINPDPSQFSKVKYKIDDKVETHTNVSLNGDHTHFLLVDNGMRYSFTGADKFRTELEESIQKPEPSGLGIPVVMLLLDGGMSSIVKCSMALKKNVPVVIVAGSGRAADLISFAVSMSVETERGEYALRSHHLKTLEMRVDSEMEEYDQRSKDVCMKMILQCCKYTNLITIYDIDSDQEMDKYILYALLKGSKISSEASRLDQLYLSVLWNRPDIAESHIFKTLSYWPTSSLEELMTIALLDEKVEFVRLFIVNGLVTSEYLTVSNLRKLYNDSCLPNKHITKLFQKSRNSTEFYLKNVHDILLALLGQHSDSVYLADTRQQCMDNTNINYYTFEDPYQELFIWAIFTNRGQLARFLWERCNSPLMAAVTGSSLYRALWRSLGAKNSELRAVYWKHREEFEKLAVEFIEECYSLDTSNAMGLIERRNKKWGELDCLELGLAGNNLNFVASSCCQASVDLAWQRGMIKLPSFIGIITIFIPILLWTKLFRFQKIGDNGGELTKFQKLIVFYKTPKVKFFAHSMSFLGFLILYSYILLFDFQFVMSTAEMLALIWLFTYMMEELNELLFQQSSTLDVKLYMWWQSVWNRFDTVAFIFAITALILRIFSSTFGYARIAYAMNTPIFFCRLLRVYHLNYSLGPKLVIFYRMLSEVLVFLLLLVVFILGYGLASQALIIPSPGRIFDFESIQSTIKQVILTPYWQMYGELMLDEIKGKDEQICHVAGPNLPDVCENPSNYTWAVQFMLIFYLIIGNIMLLNLLIAIFTYVFDEVQENSMEIWKFERYNLIREYDMKPGLVPPFLIFEHMYRILKWFWKKYLRKKKENLDDFMASSIIALRIFEKDAISSYLSKLQTKKEASIEHKMDKITERIESIYKFVEQEQDFRNMMGGFDTMSISTNMDEDQIENEIFNAAKKREIDDYNQNPSSSDSTINEEDDDDSDERNPSLNSLPPVSILKQNSMEPSYDHSKKKKSKVKKRTDARSSARKSTTRVSFPQGEPMAQQRRDLMRSMMHQQKSVRRQKRKSNGDRNSLQADDQKWEGNVNPDYITYEEINRPSSAYTGERSGRSSGRLTPSQMSSLVMAGQQSQDIESMQTTIQDMSRKIDSLTDALGNVSQNARGGGNKKI